MMTKVECFAGNPMAGFIAMREVFVNEDGHGICPDTGVLKPARKVIGGVIYDLINLCGVYEDVKWAIFSDGCGTGKHMEEFREFMESGENAPRGIVY